ncbi:hypothetical protein AB1Y20_022546 [Prymnesium parvum]|uniref:Sfi1 spindle body domain-containing protein n=1 Tax=Prymnesium parvum TaxID=97485 RepID=A0AB34JJX4_PRYPA
MRSERLVWTEPRRRRESPVEPWLPLRTVPRYLSAVTPQARPAAVSRYSRGTPAAAAIPHGVALHSMSQPPLHSPRAADPLASCRNLWSQVDQEDHLGPVGSAQASEVTSAVGGTGKYSALATLEARCLLVARDGTGKMLSSGVRMELKAAAQGFHRQWCTRDAILEMAKYSVLRKTAVVAKASQQRAVAMRHWRRCSGLDEPGNGRLDTRREWDDEWLHHAATRGGELLQQFRITHEHAIDGKLGGKQLSLRQAQLDNSYSQAWLHWGYRGTLNAMSRWKRHAAWRIRMMILVTSWHQNERGRGWRSWRQYARARSCKLKLATTSLKKWRQWQLASSWRAWRDEACAVAFRVRFCLRLGFRQWVSHSAVVSATLEAASAVWIRHAALKRAFRYWLDVLTLMTNVRRLMGRWALRELRLATDRWCEHTAARLDILKLAAVTLKQWRQWQLASSWRAWRHERRPYGVSGLLVRHAALKRAFRYWLDVLTLMTNVRRLMGRWALRELRLATDRWCEHTAARLDILKLAAVTLKQWRQWQLASSWRAWRHEVCSVSFNLRFCLRLGFRQWISHSAVVSAALRAASAVWSKWASGQVARAFATWFDSASVRASAMAVARNVVLRLMHQELSKAVWQWRRKLLQRATMTSAADHYRSIALKKIRWAAFRWSATCAFIRRMRRPLLLFTQFRGIHLLGRAWRKWVKVFFDQSKVNIVTSVVIRKWRYWQQSAAWCSWLAAAQSRAGAISLVKGSVAKWAHYTSTGRAFRRWLELTRARVAALVSTRAALVSWLNSQCMHALRSWKDYTVAAAKVSLQPLFL